MLECVRSPGDVKRLSLDEKRALAAQIRDTLISAVSQTGGHLSSNLGAVELTIALDSAFDPPVDKLIYDVGHQTYAHKLLSGRADNIYTLRRQGGLSGFPRTDESEYDAYCTGHASTAISAALGMARARDLRGEKHSVVAVVGDGALSGGMCYEALNDAGQSRSRLIVVLNDNDMSISQNVGAISMYLTKMRQSGIYRAFKQKLRALLKRMPRVGDKLTRALTRLRDSIKSLFVTDLFFGALGFEYIGPIDGHDIAQMTSVLERAKTYDEPVLVHVVTRKGRGYKPAEDSPDRYHGVAPFDPVTGALRESEGECAGQTVASALARMAARDPSIVAVSAAMLSGTGLSAFKREFPARCFDVGIAEEHAVTMAAGMALGGAKPYVAIYSTFLQRAYDQIMMDVCMNRANVTLLIDRGGLTGADGATHQGVFDLSYLRQMPGIVICAPKDASELVRMLEMSESFKGPMAIRYPKHLAQGCEREFEIGEWQVETDSGEHWILACGRMVDIALEAARALAARGVSAGVINARFVKPMDDELLARVARSRGVVVTLEDNSVVGGFGEGVVARLGELNFAGRTLVIGVKDEFVAHATVDEQTRAQGMDAQSVADGVMSILAEAEYERPGG